MNFVRFVGAKSYHIVQKEEEEEEEAAPAGGKFKVCGESGVCGLPKGTCQECLIWRTQHFYVTPMQPYPDDEEFPQAAPGYSNSN
jgi:hypothetical protein